MKTDNTTKPKKKMNLVKEGLIIGTLIALPSIAILKPDTFDSIYSFYSNMAEIETEDRNYKKASIDEIVTDFDHYDGQFVQIENASIFFWNYNERETATIYKILFNKNERKDFDNELAVTIKNNINMEPSYLHCYFTSDKAKKKYLEVNKLLSDKAYKNITIKGVIVKNPSIDAGVLYAHAISFEDNSGSKEEYFLSDRLE